MKIKFSLIFLILILINLKPSQAQIDSTRLVRVLSFNILHGATTKGDFNLEVLAKLIIDANPDFVALQEVDNKVNRSHKYDLVTELGWRTKMSPIFGRAMYYDGGGYGEGVLSKYSFLKTTNIALPFLQNQEPRAALEVICELPTKDTIAFVGTHLAHEGEEGRILQAHKINEALSNNQYPTILAGDLNAIPGSKPIDILEEMWTSSYDKENPEFTFPSNNPSKKFDYIMFYPKNRWKVISTEVIKDTYASDHCAYLVTLMLIDKN